MASDPLQLKIQSIVGLTSLFAVSVIRQKVMKKLNDFNKRITWFENYRIKNGCSGLMKNIVKGMRCCFH